MSDATLHQQIAEAEQQLKALAEKTDALKKQARETDLAKAKELIKMHGFTASELRPELKQTRNASASTTKTTTKGRAKKK